VQNGGNLTLFGKVEGTLTVGPGGRAHVCGMVQQLVVEQGASAQLDGMCTGDADNLGGDLTIGGTVCGSLIGRSHTRVAQGARVGR
jgi:hypothetical protein